MFDSSNRLIPLPNPIEFKAYLDKELDHLRIPFKEVKGLFYKGNLIGKYGEGKLYEGQLRLNGEPRISIVAWRYVEDDSFDNLFNFLKHIFFLSGEFKHKNILPFHGFNSERRNRIIIYKCEVSGSLDKQVSNWNLTWRQRLRICVGIVHGLKYIHSNSMKIYCDLRTSTILLDDKQEPKLYVRPCFTPHPSSKASDIYSLGVVLFEVLCGSTVNPRNLHDEGIFIQQAKSHYEQGNLDDLIYPDLWKQSNPESFSIFSKAAYDCLEKDPFRRPKVYEILGRLKKAVEVDRDLIYIDVITKAKSAQLMPSQIILSATRDFADKNLIGRDQFGRHYKGQSVLPNGEWLCILARRLDVRYRKEVWFSTEISMLCHLEHNNVASILGYYRANGEEIFIYEHAVHGTLAQHLSDPTLTWRRRLQICLGVARVLSCIHYDFIHCDIGSSKIFLDKDWEPKIFGFELSTKYPQSSRHRLLFSHYFKKESMTPKYDVYLFGLLLFEVLCGRILFNRDNGVKKEWDKIIDSKLREQMDTQSLTDFQILAESCLNEQPEIRPTMDQIVQALESVLELQTKHENPEHSIAADEGTSSISSKMELLSIPLKKIRSATNNFDEKFKVGEGGYGTVYRATLEVLEFQDLSAIEGKSKDEVPKKSKTVAIKRINKRSNEQGEQGFQMEYELLSSCKHQNIISLLGYSKEDSERILVYEYAHNGSLSDYLGSSRKMNLTWAQRIQICLDIANGLEYLHSKEGETVIIHRDIKSDNILLCESLNAKVADFGLSRFHLMYQQGSTFQTEMRAGTKYYMDPEFCSTGRYKKTTDVYSFGVVLFEVLSGKLAYDPSFIRENDMGLALVAKRCYREGRLKELIDPKITEEDDDHFFTLNRGPNQDSFNSFSRIAYLCLAETQAKRPTMDIIIKDLRNALKLQGETTVLSRFGLNDIKSATKNFSKTYRIGSDTYGKMYRAKLNHFGNSSLVREGRNHGGPSKISINVIIKRITNRVEWDRDEGFFTEIEMLCSRKHPNIASTIGFCDDDNEMILIYEDGSNGSLEDYLESNDKIDMFPWTKRVEMCYKIACGVNHLHSIMDLEQRVIHGDIKSADIFLEKTGETRIAYFRISKLNQANQEVNMVDIGNNIVGAKVHGDPEYEKVGKLKKESDIYSFGVILFEIFSGKLANDSVFKTERINHEMIDPKLIREEPNQDSLMTILTIAHDCLDETQDQRPTMENVIGELDKALKFQENHMKNRKMSLEEIESSTNNFSLENYVDMGGYEQAYNEAVAPLQASVNVYTNQMLTLMSRHTNCCTIL